MPSPRHAALPLILAAAACGGAPPPGAVEPPGEPDISALEVTEGEHFAVFTGEGERAGLDDLLRAVMGANAVLLGEQHDDAVTHRLQLELLQRAVLRFRGGPGAAPEGRDGSRPPVNLGQGRPVVLSLEMFERDVQPVVDEYLADLITEDHFLRSARPWDNYARDYRPLVEFARAHGVPVVAANAPRRYVNRASRLGRDSLAALGPEALQTLAPLPYPEPSDRYRAQWDSLMAGAGAHGAELSPTVIDGQSLWDATMGHSIAEVLAEEPGALVLHLAGSFHVERGTGIPETLRHYRPATEVLSVVFIPVEHVGSFDATEHLGYGDFVVLTDEGVWER